MRKKKLRDLIDIEVEEISLVDNPANKKKFLLTKNIGGIEMKDLIELLKNFIGKEDLKEEMLKGLDKETAEKTVEDLKVIDAYRASFPGELNKAISNIVATMVGLFPAPDEDGDSINKVGAKLSKETVNKLKNIIQQLQSMIGVSDEKKNDDDNKNDDVKKLEEKIEELNKKLEKALGGKGSEEEEEDIDITEDELKELVVKAIEEEIKSN